MLLPVVLQCTAAIVSPSHVTPCCVAVEYRIAAVFAAYRAIVALLVMPLVTRGDVESSDNGVWGQTEPKARKKEKQ